MKVSYVIPAYNTEKYIAECIESVLKQKHHEQIIIIDDGSTDGTLNVINRYKDKSITVISHKENKGCCYSRMEGMRLCTGDYMTFIDSDDYYLKDLPVPALFGEDIIDYGLFGAFNSTDDPEKVCSKPDRLTDEEIWQNYRIKDINQILVNKLVSKRVYSQVREKLKIDDLSNYSDNIAIMSAYAYFAKSYRCVKDIFYFYRQGSGMTSRLAPIIKFRQYCEQKKLLPRLKDIGIPIESLRKEMMQRAYSQYKWMEHMSDVPLSETNKILISKDDVKEAEKMFFEIYGEEFKIFGVENE